MQIPKKVNTTINSGLNRISKPSLLAGLLINTLLSTNAVYAESISSELTKIYKQDQRDRSAKSKDWTQINKNDKERRKRVLVLLKNSKLRTAKDYYHAAMVMQHGDSIADYSLAHILATTAAIKGHKKAKWLSAASFDRLMGATKKAQVFGTQYYKEGDKPFELKKPTNLSLIPDSLRKEFNVPTKKEAFDKLESLNKSN